ncbi:retrotransposable element Tf2 [Tanacetum coccineum]
MKSQADKHRTDREYVVGDWVYLKLQPHKQVTIRKGKQHKLSPKYYGPFQIVARKCRGEVRHSGVLPACNEQGVLMVEPVAILDRRLAKRGNTAVLPVNDGSWQSLVLESALPVMVEFWAPCRMIHPLIDELAKEYAVKLTIYKVNTDESPAIASRCGIRSIPTVMYSKAERRKMRLLVQFPDQHFA